MNLASNISLKNGPGANEHRAGSGSAHAEMAAWETQGVTMEHSKSRPFERRNFQSRHGNSRSSVGNVLPRERLTPRDVAQGQAEVLQGVFGNLKSPAKEMARDTGLSERACRNQLAGLNSMNLADFFNACAAIPEMRAWGAMMMGMGPTDPRFQEEFARGRRAITILLDGDKLTLEGNGD